MRGLSSPASAGDPGIPGPGWLPVPAFAGHDISEVWAGSQFGTAAFGLGGNAAFTLVPRSRSYAMPSALSSFGSGGI